MGSAAGSRGALPFRLTPQRAAVADAVRAAGDHPTARDIYQRVRGRLPGIGFATVYRTLNLLVGHGEILQLCLGDGVARYDGATHRHDHVVCDSCGAVADLAVPLPSSVTAAAARASGYQVSGYEVRFTGRCPGCAGSPAP